MNSGKVAIVGMACVYPGAENVTRYWSNIANGVDSTSELPSDRWPGSRNFDLPATHEAHIPCRRGGFIPTPFLFDALRFKVMPSVVRGGDPDQFILLQILGDALRDAGISEHDPRRARTDVLVGRGGYTSNKMMDIFLRADLIDRVDQFLERKLPRADREELIQQMRQSLPAVDADNMATSIPNLVASRAANRLNLRGAAYTVDAACASSLIAVEQGVRRLREGLSDVALACGVNFTHIPAFWYLFTQVLAISPSGRIRPFDRRADGLVIGEGAGAVVLKRLEDAERDGDRIYCVIRGVGSASDGGDAGVLAPASGGQLRALEAAYADAAVSPDSIRLLEAHGTATVQGDATELESIREFFGARTHTHPTRVLGSVKSMIGHTMPAAGMASLIKSGLALSNKILPPSLHCDEPLPQLAETPFFVTDHARPWLQPPRECARRAGVNAFGFGGINAHVVLEEYSARKQALPRPIQPSLERPAELLAFSGDSPKGIAAGIRRVLRFLDQDSAGTTLESLALTLASEVVREAPFKCAIVVEQTKSLKEQLSPLAEQLENGDRPTQREGLFFGEDVSHHKGKVAALFPGLAFPGLIGDYPSHLVASCAQFPEARAVFDLIEQRDGHAEDALPTSLLLDPPDSLDEEERTRLQLRFAAWVGDWLDPANADGIEDVSDTELPPIRPDQRLLSVMGMLTSNQACWRVLERFEIPFDAASGQSLGDISALCAAGCFEFGPAIERLWPFLSVDPRATELGCLAAVCTDEQTLAPWLEKYPETAIGLHLSREMLIAGGPTEQIEQLIEELRGQGVLCQKMPFPPIHTPQLESKKLDFQQIADEAPLALEKPRLDVYSNLTTERIKGEPDEMRQLIADNVTHPIRFWQTLTRMYDEGVRTFIQVGSGTLAGNVRGILQHDDVVSAAMDVDYRDPITQLRHLCGALFAAGVPLDLTAMFEARSTTVVDLDQPGVSDEPIKGAVPVSLYWPPLHNAVTEPTAARQTATAEPEAEPRSALPFVGRIVEHEPEQRIVHVRRLDLERDLFLHDHAFVGTQHELPLERRFPLVPLTVTLEMMAQTAACLAPGRGLIALKQVRARKWIALDRIASLDVEMRGTKDEDRDGRATIEVTLHVEDELVASALVEFASDYRVEIDLSFNDWPDAAAFPIEASRLYSDRHVFHGPRFQCIESIDSHSEQGLIGQLVVPSRTSLFRDNDDPQLLLDPVVLDGVGQLLGAQFLEKGIHILPVAIERIEFYRPTPESGTRVPVRVELTDYNMDERRVTAKMEAQDGEGQVWFRIVGWQDLVFRYSQALIETLRDPSHHTLASTRPLPGLPDEGVAAVVSRDLLRDSRPDSVARIYLHPDEWATFQDMNEQLQRQREWLMGRIAAKDAVRSWLARHDGGTMQLPTTIKIVHDEHGRPIVRLDRPATVVPNVSISHKGTIAAAVADASRIGLDLEPSGSTTLELEQIADADEVRRIREHVGRADASWITRLWCGKEAAAKALGTGLGGRPKAFRTVELHQGGRLIVENGEPACRVEVHTSHSDGWTFAVASIPADPTS